LRQEEILFSEPKKQWSQSLCRYVLELLSKCTVKDVARHLGMSWDTIKQIHLKALQKKYSHISLKGLSYLGVDEIAIHKGHSYMTIVVDLVTGSVVWVAKGRKISSFEEFLIKLKMSHANIKAIAVDMWPNYQIAIKRHFPDNVVVFDRYHVVSDYNRTLQGLRKQEWAKASKTEKVVFKGTRYLILMGQEKLNEMGQAKQQLERLLKLNQRLNIAYILKEELRQLWNCQSRIVADHYFSEWIKKANASGIRRLQKFAQKMLEHTQGILNYFTHRITTGPVEGINNKIKVLKRQAYGFRDFEYFKLRIYALHQSRYSLIG
jgi:transposase